MLKELDDTWNFSDSMEITRSGTGKEKKRMENICNECNAVDLYLRIAWKVEKEKNKKKEDRIKWILEFLFNYQMNVGRERLRERVNWLLNLIIIMVDLQKWTENER